MIVWSKKLYDWLPDNGQQGEEVRMISQWKDGKIYTQDKVWVYPLSNGTYCKVMAVDEHPSVGFAWDYWHELISEFLKS